MHVDLGRARAHVALERRVAVAHLFPVVGQQAQLVRIESRIARTETQRLDDRAEIRLRRQAAHRIERAVDRIASGIDRHQHAGRGDAARVVRVEVDRQPDLLLQRLDQRVRRARLAQAGHVLDAEDVRTGLLELLRHADVILQVVLRLARIAQVAGVADRGFAELARFARPRPSRRACSRPSSASRTRGTGRCPARPPAARSNARHCRDSSCNRRRWPSAAASAAAGSASLRETRPVDPTGIRAGSASQRRTSRRPSTRPRRGPARGARTPARSRPCRACESASPAATDARRVRSCRSAAPAVAASIHCENFVAPSSSNFCFVPARRRARAASAAGGHRRCAADARGPSLRDCR